MSQTAPSIAFRWEGVSARGQKRRGRLRADSQHAAIEQLRRAGWIPIRVEAAPRRSLSSRMSRRGSQIPAAELANLMTQLAAMLQAGLPLLRTLELLARQQTRSATAETLRAVAERIDAGAGLSEALAEHPRVFDSLALAMVAAGESSGQLAEAFQQLATSLERTRHIRQQLSKALFYPTTILVIGIGAAIVLLVFVVPAFAQTFASFGAELPLPTRIVIAISNLLSQLLLPALLAWIVAGLWLRRQYSNEAGQLQLDRWRLRLPVVGSLYQHAAVARVAGSLSMLLRAGVSVLTALEGAARAAGNRVIEAALLAARESVRQGQSLASALDQTAVLPPLLIEMTGVGEHTGTLDQTLVRVAIYFEAELDRRIDRLTAAIEPAAVIFLGLTLGGLVIAMYLPVFRLGTLFG